MQVASKEVGQREVGKNNFGPGPKKYLAATNLNEGNPYCAAFAKWIYKEVGIKTPGANAWSPSWFPEDRVKYKRGKRNTYKPKPGDPFGIFFQEKKRIAHLGIIELFSEEDGQVNTIEANTNVGGSREGQGVYRLRRSINAIYVVANWIGDE